MSASTGLPTIKKEMKKDRHNQNCVHNQKSQKNSILAIEVNVAEPGEPNSGRKKKQRSNLFGQDSI